MRVVIPTRAVPLVADDGGLGKLKILPLIAWGFAAATAVGIAVMAARTDLGAQRAHAFLVGMLSPPTSPDQHAEQQLSSQMLAWTQGVEKQFRRQGEIIQTLTDQRDTLADKVAVMDRQLGDLTAALGRATARMETETRLAQLAANAAATANRNIAAPKGEAQKADALRGETSRAEALKSDAPDAPPAPARGQPFAAPPPQASNPLPPGQIYPPASANLPSLSGLSAAASPAFTGALPPPVPEVMPQPMTRPFPVTAPQAAAETAAAAAARQAATRGSAKAVPMFQSNPLMTTGILDTPLAPGAASSEFAVDLGSAATIEALRARWHEVRTSQSPLLDNLKPLVALKEGGRSGQELHLVAGPIGNAATTSRLCAVLSGSGVTCHPTFYEGQHLVLR